MSRDQEAAALDVPSTNSDARDEDAGVRCPACAVVDNADGHADGRYLRPRATTTRHEAALVRSLLRAQDRTADKVTAFAGSLNFVYLHSIWFGVWVALNIGLFGTALEFDKFPFGLLTMVVSLEAIFLSTFVMVSQNRQATRSDARSQVDFENNLRAEVWAIHVGTHLGIDPTHVEDIVRLVLADADGEPDEGSRRHS